jgi:hypothetical protein
MLLIYGASSLVIGGFWLGMAAITPSRQARIARSVTGIIGILLGAIGVWFDKV